MRRYRKHLSLAVSATVLLVPLANDCAGGDATGQLTSGSLSKADRGQWHAPGGKHCSWKKYLVHNGQAFILDKGSGLGRQNMYVFTSDVTQKAKFRTSNCGTWTN